MAKIQLHAKVLKAVSRIAPPFDIRYFLCGVCVEATQGSTTLIATDGHRIMAAQHKAENDIEEDVRIIIPREIVMMITAGKRSEPSRLIPLEKAGDKWSVGLPPINEFQVQFKPIEAKYPNWRAVVKSATKDGVSGEVAMFNARYLKEMFDLAKDLHHPVMPAATLLHNGDSAGVIHFGETSNEFKVVGLVMPMRAECGTALPDLSWAYPAEDEETDKATETSDATAEEEAAV